MRVRLGVPDDVGSIQQARRLADSLLRAFPSGAVDPTFTAVAALTGHYSSIAAMRNTRTGGTARVDVPGRSLLDAAVLALHLDVAAGAAQSRVDARARRVDSLIGAVMPVALHEAVRSGAFSRAAALGYPGTRLPPALLAAIPDDYLVTLIVAATQRDSTGLRIGMNALINRRREGSPPDLVAFDALVAEAALLVETGDAVRAAEWLDAAFRTQRNAVPDFDPVNAVAFVRAMRLRSEIATRLGDIASATRWRRAVSELWGAADGDAAARLAQPILSPR